VHLPVRATRSLLHPLVQSHSRLDVGIVRQVYIHVLSWLDPINDFAILYLVIVAVARHIIDVEAFALGSVWVVSQIVIRVHSPQFWVTLRVLNSWEAVCLIDVRLEELFEDFFFEFC
jgi:hypothetical protein